MKPLRLIAISITLGLTGLFAIVQPASAGPWQVVCNSKYSQTTYRQTPKIMAFRTDSLVNHTLTGGECTGFNNKGRVRANIFSKSYRVKYDNGKYGRCRTVSVLNPYDKAMRVTVKTYKFSKCTNAIAV